MPTSTADTSSREVRYAGWAGVAAVPLLIATIPLAPSRFPDFFPSWGFSSAELSSWFADYRTQVVIQATSSVAPLLIMIWQAVVLARLFRAGGNRGVAGQIMITMFTAYSIGVQLTNPFYLVAALAGTPSHPADADVAHYSYEMAIGVGMTFAIYGAGGLLTVAIANRGTSVLPRWLVAFGIVVAAGHFMTNFSLLVSSGWLSPASLTTILPLVGTFVWQGLVGVRMLRLARTMESSPVSEQERVHAATR